LGYRTSSENLTVIIYPQNEVTVCVNNTDFCNFPSFKERFDSDFFSEKKTEEKYVLQSSIMVGTKIDATFRCDQTQSVFYNSR